MFLFATFILNLAITSLADTSAHPHECGPGTWNGDPGGYNLGAKCDANKKNVYFCKGGAFSVGK